MAEQLEKIVKKLQNEKKWVIYGAGYAGKLFYKYIKNNNLSIESFAETEKDVRKNIDGIPVYGLDHVLELYHSENIGIILAVTNKNRTEMEKELVKRKIHSYIKLSDILLYEIEQKNRTFDAKRLEMAKQKLFAENIVGYLRPGYRDADYAEQRLIINKIEGVSYVALPKETIWINRIGTKFEEDLETYKMMTEACYCPNEYKPEVDLIQTFNMVCDTKIPWCAFFETRIPRVWPKDNKEETYYLQLIDYIKQSNCKNLYALCKNAYKIQRKALETHLSSSEVEFLMKKTKVLHPPQKILITEKEFEKKYSKDKIHFIFIGAGFFYKGGREVIQVLSEFEEKEDFKLTLISSLFYDDYFTKTPYEEMIRCRKIIHEKTWIDYYESLPNETVLEKCREATVGFLPSVAETYGYAVLEMQAAGCPVVTTNIGAFPETNNENCGWICRMPIDEFGNCIERNTTIWSEILQKELRKCVEEIFEHPEKIREKGRNALERIRKMHDPYKYQMELKKSLF